MNNKGLAALLVLIAIALPAWEILVEYEAIDLDEGAAFSMTSVSGLYRF